MAPQIVLVVPACALNGESPGWNPFFKKLFWVDIRGPALHAFDPATGKDECWEMPAWIGCQAPAPSGAVVALRTGLYDFNAKTGALILLAPPPFDPRRFIFNDGRCDPQGRFFVGPMYAPLAPDDQSRAPRAAPLWRFDPDATTSWTTATPLVATSNGLAWSPDGKTMYHSDTNSRMIWAYDYDPATGSTDRRRLFAHVESEAEMGGPDGASVDSQGFYWCAVFASGCLLRFDPAVKLERRVLLPVKYPTMPAFGGEGLNTLFVTSANWPLSHEERNRRPNEGGLFAMEAPAPGLPTTPFNLARNP
ncbi:SMP-30/gluconolactonase/LRE family protein [Rhodoblastus sp.]|uniref:SMP-30/gluconolactonase/LRE family protein n=1 Tax=Rhodoblastus sp. TaxID=1962975 RepID=UPI003F98BC85